MDYARSYKSTLKREMSAAAEKRKAEKEAALTLEKKLEREKREEELKSEQSRLEKRSREGLELVLRLKKMRAEAAARKEEHQDDEKTEPVLNKCDKKASENKIESKVLLSKAPPKPKNALGIKINVAPMPLPLYQAPPVCAASPICRSDKSEANAVKAGEPRTAFSYDKKAQAFEYRPVNFAPPSFCSIDAAKDYACQYEDDGPPLEIPIDRLTFTDEKYNASLEYEAFSDDIALPENFEAFTDADSAIPDFPSYTDADHTAVDFVAYTDADHTAADFPSYTDVDHTAVDFAAYTDVDHTSTDFGAYTDVEHTAPDFDTYTDADAHDAQGYDLYASLGEAYPHDSGHYEVHYESYEDEKAVAAYEAMLMRRERSERRFTGYDAGDAESAQFQSPVDIDFDQTALVTYDFSSYNEAELLRYFKSSEKRVRGYERAIGKKRRAMANLTGEDKSRALLDIVNLNKHIADHRAMALVAVIASKNKKHVKARRRMLTDSINEYNSALSDYEARCGESFNKVPLTLVADIAGGGEYKPIPLILYKDEFSELPEAYEDLPFEDGTAATRRERNREKLRIAKEARREEKRIKNLARVNTGLDLDAGEKLSSVGAKIERDVVMLRARFDSLKLDAESRLDYLDYSYSASGKDKNAERKALKSRIRVLKRLKKSALKHERRDSERYYSQLFVNADKLGITGRLKLEKLDSLNMRLDALLSERERINEQLIKLYSGDVNGEGDKKINFKIKKIKRSVARRTSKRFRRDMEVLEKRVPLDIKEKLAKSVNKIIDAEVLSSVLKYKLRHTKPRGEARREMKQKIKVSRASLKYYLSDYRRFLKRARTYAMRVRRVKIQIVWILAILAATVSLIAIYLRFRDPVNVFFYKIFSYL